MATTPYFAQNAWTGSRVAPPRGPSADPEPGNLLKLAFGLLLLDTFLTASRILEIGSNLGVSLPHVEVGIHILVFGLAFITGGARRMAASRTGVLLILYTGWVLVCTPLSTWRTGSAQTILYNWLPSVVVFFASGLLFTLRQCRKFASVLALSGLTIALASLLIGKYDNQRLALAEGTLSNANDLSMLLLLAATFFAIPLLDPASHLLLKVLSLIAGVLVIVISFRTGSRAGLVALLAIVLTLFLTRSTIGKMKLLAGCVALSVVVLALVPSYNLDRYATIFSDSDSPELARTNEAYGSSELRKELLRESVNATLEHPIFGVGPGVYAPAMAKVAERQGRNANWRVSHNTYTQVSSETGIPGLILYLLTIISAYLDIFWTRKHSRQNRSYNAVTLGLLLSLVGLNVNFFFNSSAYAAWLPILLGLGTALRLSVKRAPERQASVTIPGAAATGPSAVKTVPASQIAPAPAPAPVYTYRFLGRRPRVRH